jgi:hypothetical protein
VFVVVLKLLVRLRRRQTFRHRKSLHPTRHHRGPGSRGSPNAACSQCLGLRQRGHRPLWRRRSRRIPPRTRARLIGSLAEGEAGVAVSSEADILQGKQKVVDMPIGRRHERREDRREAMGRAHYKMRQRLVSIGDNFWIETSCR